MPTGPAQDTHLWSLSSRVRISSMFRFGASSTFLCLRLSRAFSASAVRRAMVAASACCAASCPVSLTSARQTRPYVQEPAVLNPGCAFFGLSPLGTLLLASSTQESSDCNVAHVIFPVYAGTLRRWASLCQHFAGRRRMTHGRSSFVARRSSLSGGSACPCTRRSGGTVPFAVSATGAQRTGDWDYLRFPALLQHGISLLLGILGLSGRRWSFKKRPGRRRHLVRLQVPRALLTSGAPSGSLCPPLPTRSSRGTGSSADRAVLD